MRKQRQDNLHDWSGQITVKQTGPSFKYSLSFALVILFVMLFWSSAHLQELALFFWSVIVYIRHGVYRLTENPGLFLVLSLSFTQDNQAMSHSCPLHLLVRLLLAYYFVSALFSNVSHHSLSSRLGQKPPSEPPQSLRLSRVQPEVTFKAEGRKYLWLPPNLNRAASHFPWLLRGIPTRPAEPCTEVSQPTSVA